MYKFYKSNTNLIRVRNNNDKPLCIELNTNLSSDIFVICNNHYIQCLVNDHFKHINLQIFQEAEAYLQQEQLLNFRTFKTNEDDDKITLKLQRAYNRYKTTFFDKDQPTISTSVSMYKQATLIISLDFIWLSNTTWGFTWKVDSIKII
jgi:hypothetical protein